MTGDAAEEAQLDLACPVCGHTACLTDVTPLRFEHAVDTWARVHRHTDAEVDGWRTAYAADAAAARLFYHEHGGEPDGEEP